MPPVSTALDHVKALTSSAYAIIDPQTRKTYWFSYITGQPNQEIPLLKRLRPAAYKDLPIETMQSNVRAALGGLIYVNSFTNTDKMVNYL